MFTRRITSLFKPLTSNLISRFSVEAAKTSKPATTKPAQSQSKPAQSSAKIGQISQVINNYISRLLVQL
jgi:hypothetical protein